MVKTWNCAEVNKKIQNLKPGVVVHTPNLGTREMGQGDQKLKVIFNYVISL